MGREGMPIKSRQIAQGTEIHHLTGAPVAPIQTDKPPGLFNKNPFLMDLKKVHRTA